MIHQITLGRFAAHMLFACAAMTAGSTRILAQEAHAHPAPEASKSNLNTGALLDTVRIATARFKDVHAALAEGYVLQFGCVTGADSGAMGMHYVNGDLVNKGVLDPMKPQIVIYEPMPDGSLKLIGADYLVLVDTWKAQHPGSAGAMAPEMMGQFFHLFDAPNRFGLPPFYTLHVWAWKDNPAGAFTNWHPNVSCNSYAGK
jgi:hypothetical protein